MEKQYLRRGIYPTMITPFTDDDQVDYTALEAMIEWYIAHGAVGLFAVCQSSEMFYLTLEERASIARFVQEQAAGRVQVIASGHIADTIEEQIAELQVMADTGVSALVLVSNRMADEHQSDEIWKQNTMRILDSVSDIPLGIYECPYPYKRLLSPQLLNWCQQTGRFFFLKDTCCSIEQIEAKLQAVQGGALQLYNANAATYLDSLQLGAYGYSGVMANFHPDLYAWLDQSFSVQRDKAERLQQFLSVASVIESQYYPVNAKYYLQLEGLPIGLHTRTKNSAGLTAANRLELEHLRALTQGYRQQYIQRGSE